MSQRYRIIGAAALALVGIVALLYTQTMSSHTSGPCTLAHGLIHCSAPYHARMLAQQINHPLVPLGVVVLALGAGLLGWAIFAARSQPQPSNVSE